MSPSTSAPGGARYRLATPAGAPSAPDVERRAGYQRQQIAAFFIEEQIK